MIYYFVEFAGSFANIALLTLFVDRLFQKKDLSSRWLYLYIALLIAGQCILSLFPTWVTPRTIYILLGGFLLAMLFYEAQIWQAIFASAAFFTLVAVVEILAMLLIGLRIPDTDVLMQAGAARLIYEKMLSMGIRSLSAYIRKMALDGYCLHLDLKELQRMAYLLQMCSNNLNQYAKAANENGRVYAADMEDLRQRLDELIGIGKQILSKLAEL